MGDETVDSNNYPYKVQEKARITVNSVDFETRWQNKLVDEPLPLTAKGISTLLKRWHTEIHKKDVTKNYMIGRLDDWIKKLQQLRHEIMMRKS